MWSWAPGLMNATLRLAQADPVAAGSAPAAAAGKAAEGAAQGAGSGMAFQQILIFVAIFAVFWLLVLRPQQKKAKDHRAFVDSLKIGSRVVTSSGIFGKVTGLDGNEVSLEIADKVVIRVLRSNVAGLEANADQAVANSGAR
jgi:preprotein translocase subunit YajC